MSTPQYPAGGASPHGQGADPYAPGLPAGAPPVPGPSNPHGAQHGQAPYAAPGEQNTPYGAPAAQPGPGVSGGQPWRPGGAAPGSQSPGHGDPFAAPGASSPAASRPFAAYAQVPVDPSALAAAAPLGAPSDPFAPPPQTRRQAGGAPQAPAAPAAAGPVASPAWSAAGDHGASAPIDFVPGITQDPPPRTPAPAAPAESPVATPPAATPEVSADAPFLPGPSGADDAAAETAAAAVSALVWDDGVEMALAGRVIIGRNPEAEEGSALAPVRDETLSLSKTHFDVEVSDEGAWLTDRHSTNGVTIVRGGERIVVKAGERTALVDGDALEMGDRIATFRSRA